MQEIYTTLSVFNNSRKKVIFSRNNSSSKGTGERLIYSRGCKFLYVGEGGDLAFESDGSIDFLIG
jgi:hypothetical protein